MWTKRILILPLLVLLNACGGSSGDGNSAGLPPDSAIVNEVATEIIEEYAVLDLRANTRGKSQEFLLKGMIAQKILKQKGLNFVDLKQGTKADYLELIKALERM